MPQSHFKVTSVFMCYIIINPKVSILSGSADSWTVTVPEDGPHFSTSVMIEEISLHNDFPTSSSSIPPGPELMVTLDSNCFSLLKGKQTITVTSMLCHLILVRFSKFKWINLDSRIFAEPLTTMPDILSKYFVGLYYFTSAK